MVVIPSGSEGSAVRFVGEHHRNFASSSPDFCFPARHSSLTTAFLTLRYRLLLNGNSTLKFTIDRHSIGFQMSPFDKQEGYDGVIAPKVLDLSGLCRVRNHGWNDESGCCCASSGSASRQCSELCDRRVA